MAKPFTGWFTSSQGPIALDVAGIGFATIADEHDITFLSTIAVVADPIHFLILFGLVLELLRLNFELFAFVPIISGFSSTVGTPIGTGEPFLKAVVAELMLTLEEASVLDLVKADRTFVFLHFPHLF
jgi:hypothetical protein